MSITVYKVVHKTIGDDNAPVYSSVVFTQEGIGLTYALGERKESATPMFVFRNLHDAQHFLSGHPVKSAILEGQTDSIQALHELTFYVPATWQVENQADLHRAWHNIERWQDDKVLDHRFNPTLGYAWSVQTDTYICHDFTPTKDLSEQLTLE